MEKTVSKSFSAEVEILNEVLAFSEEFLEANGCGFKMISQFSIVLEELFVNIASYAYPDGGGDCTIGLSVADGKLECVISDSGVAFDPLSKADPDITLSAEERKIGGLGIFMVRNMMDEVIYERRDGKNILTIRKKL